MIARASFWLVRNEPLPVSSRLLRGALHRFLADRPLLICRSPVADASGLILPDPPLRGPALESILSAAGAYARDVKASFVVFDYLTSSQAGLADWPSGLAQAALSEPGTCLPVTWGSFEEYLKGLSKSAWKDYRRQHNQARRMDLEITSASVVDGVEEALPLIRSVEARHGSAPKPWARALLEAASSTAGSNHAGNRHTADAPFTWITARIHGRLVGCGLLLVDGDACLATLLGLDYSVSYVYFQIVYMAIQQAIQRGARLLRAGSGAYELKQRLGFQLEYTNHLRFTGQGRLLNQLGRLAAAWA